MDNRRKIVSALVCSGRIKAKRQMAITGQPQSQSPDPFGLPPIIRAVLWFFLTLLCFMAMMISARQLSTTMSAFEILGFRSLIGVLILLPFMWRGGRASLTTRKLPLHGGRAVIQFSAQFCWIYGVALLPLVEVTALEFTVPIWTALLAMPLLAERMGIPKWLATLGGFAGVVVMLRPGITAVSPAALVVLAGCILFAANHVAVKYLTRSDDPKLIVFYMNAFQLPMGLIPAAFMWVTPAAADFPWIAVWGTAGLLGNYSMARAFRLADATLISPLDFLRLPFIAIIGYFVYSEAVELWTLLGAAIIFGSNYFSVEHEARRLDRRRRGRKGEDGIGRDH